MPWFIAIALLIASALISSLLVKTQKQKPATLEDFDFPQADEGTPQAILFGDDWNDGWQVLHYGNLRTVKIKSSGKK